MLLNLANMYGSRVKEPISHNKLPYTEEKYALVGIATQVSTFQKLSLVSLDLIALFIKMIYLWLSSIYSYIIAKILPLPKQIIALIAALILVFNSYSTYASDANNLEEMLSITEDTYSIPRGLLKAIARVESGVRPYAVNISGRAVIAKDQKEALRVIEQAKNDGITNIDIGVMQLNYRWHKEGFSSIASMLNMENNILYAAKFLVQLKQQYGDWQTAVQHYHSAKPEHHRPYAKKVLMAWIGG